jgi:ferredoxin
VHGHAEDEAHESQNEAELEEADGEIREQLAKEYGIVEPRFGRGDDDCILCGLCIDVGPTDTLRYSQRYDDAAFHRVQTVNDLLVPFGEDPYLTGKLK